MSPRDPDLLVDAYLRTTYLARLPGGDAAIRIGEPPPPELVSALSEHRVATWAFISAANPGSDLLCVEGNLARNSALRTELMRAGLPWFPGEGIGDDPSWPAEPSFLVLGLDEHAAVALGQLFGQVAIVTGSGSRPADLVLCA